MQANSASVRGKLTSFVRTLNKKKARQFAMEQVGKATELTP